MSFWLKISLAILGFVCCYYPLNLWLQNPDDKTLEPLSAIIASIAAIIMYVGESSVEEFWFNEESRKRRATKNENERNCLEILIKRIDIELPNLRHIESKKPYSGQSHQKAVEVTSIELLEVDVAKLKNYPQFRKSAERLESEFEKIKIQPIGNKAVSDAISLIDDLRKAVHKRIAQLGVSKSA